MEFKETMDRNWLVVELVPDLIVVHTGIQFGDTTIKGTRIPTDTAAFAFQDGNFAAWDMTEKQAFAAYCFEAGKQFNRNRKLRKRIGEAVAFGWSKEG
jgi:uncharacterized protein (DUF433 family)